MSPHGHHHDDPHATIDTPGATHDPVCGHWVIPEKAHGSSVYQGETIHFCSLNCKRAFDKSPERFIGRLQRPRAPTRPSVRSALPPTRNMGLLDKMREQADAPAAPAEKVQDPVCHMMIDPAKAAGKTEHGSDTFYFCSPGCKTKFDADPAHYLSPQYHGSHGMD